MDDTILFIWLIGVDVVLSLWLVLVCIGYLVFDFERQDWRYRRYMWWESIGVKAAGAILVMISGGLFRSTLSWWLLVQERGVSAHADDVFPGGWIMHSIALILLVTGKIMLLYWLAPSGKSSGNLLWRMWQGRYIVVVSTVSAVVLSAGILLVV